MRLELVRKTRPNGGTGARVAQAAGAWGAGPRAVQNLILGGAAGRRLLGSYMVRLEDVQEVAAPVLTHRVITTFAAQAEGVTPRRRRAHGWSKNRAPRREWCGLDFRRPWTRRQDRSARRLSSPSETRSDTTVSLIRIEPQFSGRAQVRARLARRAAARATGRCKATCRAGTRVRIAARASSSPSTANTSPATTCGGSIGERYGRSDRFYIKEFEADTNLRCCLVVDTSGSMGFGSTGITKIRVRRRSRWRPGLPGRATGRRRRAGVRRRRHRHRDATAAQPGALRTGVRSAGENQTDAVGLNELAPVLHELGRNDSQRALVVIMSDLFTEPCGAARLLRALSVSQARLGCVPPP